MISRLKGLILEKHPPSLLLELAGVGYEVHMPMTCFYELPNEGEETIIFTHFVIRKDTQLLFGFNKKQERTLFRNLIKINGIGPKLALAILSGMSTQQFINTVEQEDSAALIKLPGIGRKTAKHLIIEMKDRYKNLYRDFYTPISDVIFNSSNTASVDNAEQDAISALVVLGYKPQDASRMVNKIAKPNLSSESMIREALRAAL